MEVILFKRRFYDTQGAFKNQIIFESFPKLVLY